MKTHYNARVFCVNKVRSSIFPPCGSAQIEPVGEQPSCDQGKAYPVGCVHPALPLGTSLIFTLLDQVDKLEGDTRGDRAGRLTSLAGFACGPLCLHGPASKADCLTPERGGFEVLLGGLAHGELSCLANARESAGKPHKLDKLFERNFSRR